ncbi:tetraacyldisaccharide 4'-kinase [Syntrophotalea acetylenica]|jgi:tetraacyldisaccharide 4'-kinase|uniref:Tetraacyldisaccharide 4'-kinase n=1 Tax=Syntrophotalea acetylenica TaxID=29542 RepID=A0A1L3GHR6_SYNAC|nr:tetraacyldisaccharide 4'-kinase [Syntrophotalea acetylenica]APG25494.1 tetraacyldisaccharide 4'-kinase [Syntrophotalea acetylenica]APG43559.1 hypothetical protein A6070_05040 [Syntrophotalea acetylenica]
MFRPVLFYRRLGVAGPHAFLEWLVYVLLLPVSFLYAALMRLRAFLYRIGWLHVYRAPVPVISVGNLSVGGTGKTPVVDYLIRCCLSRGRRVAVVSRGYGSADGPALRVVSAGKGPVLDVRQAGDEPWLLARRNPCACVVVAPRRADGVRYAVDCLGADLVLLDDGFQHLAVARDFDLVLLDASRPFGNGRVLPAGILREPISALKRGSLFLLTRASGPGADPPLLPGPVLRCRHVMADHAIGPNGNSWSFAQLAKLRGLAFAGIAEPQNFFHGLEQRGLKLHQTLCFSDHTKYDGQDLSRLVAASVQADYLITTEKDAVKLMAARLPLPCYVVTMDVEFFETGELEKRLFAVIDAKG